MIKNCRLLIGTWILEYNDARRIEEAQSTIDGKVARKRE